VSRGCHGLATMERLWSLLLERHFGHVMLSLPKLLQRLGPTYQLSSHRKFGTLALWPCNTCDKVLLPAQPSADKTRYPKPHLCDLCPSLCCATCNCGCQCLDPACDDAMSESGHYECRRCRGWAHVGCEKGGEVELCMRCGESYCSGCDALFWCEECCELACYDCGPSDENGDFACAKCRENVNPSESRAVVMTDSDSGSSASDSD
jgi:hypothetical protein